MGRVCSGQVCEESGRLWILSQNRGATEPPVCPKEEVPGEGVVCDEVGTWEVCMRVCVMCGRE